MSGLLCSYLIEKRLVDCNFRRLRLLEGLDGSFNFLEVKLVRVMETLDYLDLAIELLEDRVFFFRFFLRNQVGLNDRYYLLLIREVP